MYEILSNLISQYTVCNGKVRRTELFEFFGIQSIESIDEEMTNLQRNIVQETNENTAQESIEDHEPTIFNPEMHSSSMEPGLSLIQIRTTSGSKNSNKSSKSGSTLINETPTKINIPPSENQVTNYKIIFL